MLGSKNTEQTNKFDTNILQNQSLLMKRPVNKTHQNLIVNQEMKPSFRLKSDLENTHNVMQLCEFSVLQSGYYHISSGITIQNVSELDVETLYFQFGICNKDMSNFNELLKSNVMNTRVLPQYMMSDTLSSIVYLEKDIKTHLWLNIGISNNDEMACFEYKKEHSNLRLYKL